jgi:aminopeptidase N
MTFHDPTSHADLSQGQIKHIDFRIRTDFKARVLDIEATYQINAPLSGSFFLDTFKLEIQKAHVNGRALEWEMGAHSDTLGSRLELKGLDQTDVFSLVFRTSPDATALQWTDPAQTAGGKHPFLFSQCQDIHARSVFPCQDTPSVRFTYSAEVEVPRGLTAVMAAEQLGGQGQGAAFVFKFRMPQPIPSYLFAIGVANLEFRALGARTGIYAEPETIEAAAWEFAENEKRMIEAEKLLGPYLWGRYDLLVLPPSFPFGGMENPRLTFVTPTAIVGTRGQTNLITHELAHAWTGNLITNATWADFWLNEGWTTYAEMRITETLEGAEFRDLVFVFHLNEILDAMKNRLGMDAPQTRLKRTDTSDDDGSGSFSIPYYKGASFLIECEKAVGRERFDPFIHKYTKRYQFQSLTTEAFLDFFKEELPEVFEKVDVHEWIYGPGMPASWKMPESKLYNDVQAVLKDYKAGKRPDKARVQGWLSDQVLCFLQGLPAQIPVDDCKYFEDALDLAKRNDNYCYSWFYCICIASGYEAIWPRVENYAGRIGRMLYILPVIRAVVSTEWTRGRARQLVEQVRAKHHPVTASTMERMLAAAGV